MNIEKFSKLLLTQRKTLGWTSQQTAQILKVSPAYYSKLENGKEKPSRALVADIISKFQLALEDSRLLEQYAGYGTGSSIIDQTSESGVDQASLVSTAPSFDRNTQVLYSDAMYITITENGVVLDFAQQQGATTQQDVVSRIGLSHEHAKKISDLLVQQLRQFRSRQERAEN